MAVGGGGGGPSLCAGEVTRLGLWKGVGVGVGADVDVGVLDG